MTRFPRLRTLLCLALAWLCAWVIAPAQAQPLAAPTGVIAIDNVLPTSGLLQNGGFTNDNHLIFNGYARVSSTVLVYDNKVPIGTAQASVLGAWIYSPPVALGDGAHSFTFTDSIDNDISPPSTAFEFTVDTIAPPMPVLTSIMPNGPIANDGSTTFTFTGTAEPDISIYLFDQGIFEGQNTSTASGDWTVTLANQFLAGPHQFQAQAIDKAGNASPLTAVHRVAALANDSLLLPDGGGQAQVGITSDTDGCTLDTPPAFSRANLADAPPSAIAPLGALAFTATGCSGVTLTVRITYPPGSLATLAPYKFGPSSANAASTWFAHGSIVGDSVTYTVTDNGVGDNDIVTPGVIADTFAPMASAPSAPSNIVAIPANESATVSFDAPADTGGTDIAITSYTVTSSPGGINCPVTINTSSTAQTCTATGLTNGQSYTFSVVATNSAKLNSPAAQSNAVVPMQVLTLTAPANVPSAQQGEDYRLQLAASGGTPSYRFALASGSAALPNDLELDPATGLVSGTPTAAAGSYPVIFEVTDSNGRTATLALTVTVALADVRVPPANQTLPAAVVGVAYSASIVATGGAAGGYGFTVSAGQLPAGLDLHPDTGAITGTPTQEGTASFSITIVDSTLKSARAKAGGTTVHSTTQAFGITVTAAAVNPPATTPTPVPSLSVIGIVLLNLMAAVFTALGLRWRLRQASA